MNKLTTALIATILTVGSISAHAATSTENKDDASNLGTSDSPQVIQQQNRTDKGASEAYQTAPSDNSSNLGNSNSPQVVNQSERTDKGPAQDLKARNADNNKVLKAKEDNHGTTKGNQIQPTQPESAAPATK